MAEKEHTSVYDILNEELLKLSKSNAVPSYTFLTKDLHVLPYFHGNRSPRADPTLKGGISGLKLDSGISSLAILYLATVQAIAYGTRHIIEEMNKKGYNISTIFMTGGSVKNRIYIQEHANISGNLTN
jgi:ribulose kinase